ncbi:MAG: hypothetical protein V3U84_11260 [Thiotrichaceae bacterium]
MKKNTLLKLSPIMLLLSLLAGSANVAFADEKAAEVATEAEKPADNKGGDSKDDKKKDGKKGDKEPDCE